jgi:hypothetical protein
MLMKCFVMMGACMMDNQRETEFLNFIIFHSHDDITISKFAAMDELSSDDGKTPYVHGEVNDNQILENKQIESEERQHNNNTIQVESKRV